MIPSAAIRGAGTEELSDVASILSDLHSDRLAADYQLDVARVETVDLARSCVERSLRIAILLDGCDSPATRENVRQAIAEYERRISG